MIWDWHKVQTGNFTPVWQRVKTKSQNVFGANSYVCRNYRGKTRRRVFLSTPTPHPYPPPPPPPSILNRVKAASYAYPGAEKFVQDRVGIFNHIFLKSSNTSPNNNVTLYNHVIFLNFLFFTNSFCMRVICISYIFHI